MHVMSTLFTESLPPAVYHLDQQVNSFVPNRVTRQIERLHTLMGLDVLYYMPNSNGANAAIREFDCPYLGQMAEDFHERFVVQWPC